MSLCLNGILFPEVLSRREKRSLNFPLRHLVPYQFALDVHCGHYKSGAEPGVIPWCGEIGRAIARPISARAAEVGLQNSPQCGQIRWLRRI